MGPVSVNTRGQSARDAARSNRGESIVESSLFSKYLQGCKRLLHIPLKQMELLLLFQEQAICSDGVVQGLHPWELSSTHAMHKACT